VHFCFVLEDFIEMETKYINFSLEFTEYLKIEPKLMSFEKDLYQKLIRPTYAAYYLLDAFECRDEEPGGIVRALKDIITANDNNWLLPCVTIHYSTLYLQPEELEAVVDYLSVTLAPECAAHLVAHDMFQFYRDVISELKARGKPFSPHEISLSIERVSSDQLTDGPGLQRAKTALQQAVKEVHQSQVFNEVAQILVTTTV